MIKRFVVAGILYLFASAGLYAQLRNSVTIVRPHLSEYGKDTCMEIARFFRDRDAKDVADYFKSLTEDNSFGSGFVIQGRDETELYVVTNGHVVVFADYVTLEFQDYDESYLVLENCPVIYRDDLADLAVIRVPNGVPENVQALSLADKSPNDGRDVWSAGYPFLLDGPSWQLGKGTVTNERLTVWQVGLQEYSVFIQHSAPLSNGNSGGPLLIGSPFDGNLQVVGVNTWILMGSQNANFAIHLDVLTGALQRMSEVTGYNPDQESLVQSRANDFIAMMKAEEWDMYDASRFISQHLVAEQGWSVFRNGVSGVGSAESKDWIERFYHSPLEALNQFIYFSLYDELHDNGENLELVSIDYVASETGETLFRTGIQYGKKIIYFDWRYETGGWKILAAGVPGAGLKGPKAVAVKTKVVRVKEEMPADGYDLPSGFRFSLGNTELPTVYGWVSTVSVELGYAFTLGRAMTLDVVGSRREAVYEVSESLQTCGIFYGVDVGLTYGHILPLNKVSIIPFLKMGGSAAWDTVYGKGPYFVMKPVVGATLMTSKRFGMQVRMGPVLAFDSGILVQGVSLEAGLIF